MEKQNQPLQRSTALQPLSREHHDALLFVWKIRQGVDRSIPLERLSKYCLWYRDTHLQTHMVEEEVALTRILSEDNQLMNNMLEDHAAIRSKIDEVIEEPGYESLKRLAQIVYYHVRFEERVLFPAIEKIASAYQLSQIGKDLEHAPKTSDWPDAFWSAAKVSAA